MTIPRYMALSEYWREWPPVHQLVAVFMGYKSTQEKKEASLDDFLAAAKQMSGG